MSDTTATTDAGAQAATDGQQAQTRTYSQEEYDGLKGQLSETRKEAASYRTKAREFEQNLEQFKDGMTAEQAQKLRTDYSQLSERLTAAESRALDSDIRATAKELGFTDPSDALALIDRSALKVKDGEATNVRDVLERLKEAKPHLLGPVGTIDAGARGKSPGMTPNEWLRRQIPGR